MKRLWLSCCSVALIPSVIFDVALGYISRGNVVGVDFGPRVFISSELLLAGGCRGCIDWCPSGSISHLGRASGARSWTSVVPVLVAGRCAAWCGAEPRLIDV